jgi:hypothetical protein
MSSVIISGDTSGSITLSAPAVAGTNTITLPASTGTVMVSGNMPAFSAYSSGGTSVATATVTKLAFNTKIFDTANCYDTTNYRFTPNVAGYYMFNAVTRFGSMTASQCYARIYKNGSSFNQGSGSGVASGYVWPTANWLVYMNGTTDYVEAYAYQTSGSTQSADYTDYYQFTGCLVRTA